MLLSCLAFAPHQYKWTHYANFQCSVRLVFAPDHFDWTHYARFRCGVCLAFAPHQFIWTHYAISSAVFVSECLVLSPHMVFPLSNGTVYMYKHCEAQLCQPPSLGSSAVKFKHLALSCAGLHGQDLCQHSYDLGSLVIHTVVCTVQVITAAARQFLVNLSFSHFLDYHDR